VALKKLLTAVALLVAATLCSVVLVRWRPPRAPAPPVLERVARAEGALWAGVAEVPLDLPGAVPVAGYPRVAWTSQGTRDPVFARALVLSEPGASVALVSVEILLVPGSLDRAVANRVRDLNLDALVIAATHTHAGPGGYWSSAVGEWIATGPYEPAILDALAGRIAEAVRRAAAARAPATLATARADLAELVRSRSGEVVDGRLLALRLARAGGAPLAEVLVFPAHATTLGKENRRLSGDWPGVLAQGRPVPTLFFQGAVGDQSVSLPGGAPGATPETYAAAVAAKLAALAFPPGDPRPPLAAASVRVVLPDVRLGALPAWLRLASANLLQGAMPAEGRITALQLGPVLLAAVPAEPTGAVGQRWRETVAAGAEVIALAGDYLGYVESAERVRAHAGEAARTYYGPDLEARLALGVAAGVEALRPAQRAEAAQNRKASPGAESRAGSAER